MSTAAEDPFGEARLLQSARKAAGLEDFGPEPFVEPMRVQLDSLRSAPLNDLGVMILRGMLLRSLIQRLRTQHWCTEHPEILQKYRVMSSRGIVINGKLEYTGGLDEKTFRDQLKKHLTKD